MDQGKPLTATDSPLVDFDAVCQKVRAAVEPARSHAVSLHDELGDVLWLSESSMGPDEHNAVLQAAETFTDPSAASALAFDLGDLRSAVLVRAVNTRRAMVGVIMIIMDTRIVAQGAYQVADAEDAAGADSVRRHAPGSRARREPANPSRSHRLEPLQQAGGRIELEQPRHNSARSAPAQPAPRTAAPSARAAPPPAKTEPPPSQRRSARAQPQRRRDLQCRVRSPTVDAILIGTKIDLGTGAANCLAPRAASCESPDSHPLPRLPPPCEPADRCASADSASAAACAPLSLEPPAIVAASPSIEIFEKPQKGVTPEIDRLHAALRKSPIALHVQRLVPLSKGGQLKRYEVLLRSGSEESPNAAPHAMLKAAVDNGLGSMIDRRVLTELISWLIRHPESCAGR